MLPRLLSRNCISVIAAVLDHKPADTSKAPAVALFSAAISKLKDLFVLPA
jgi:hypothetical protein